MDIRSKLRRLSQLAASEIGMSEENIKQKIVVPLLESLGHSRNDLDFEYGSQRKRIDIFIKGLPTDCRIVIDTKKFDEDLNNHLEQISLYAFQEGAILALMINGEEIRIYDPFFRGYSIKDSLLFSIKRKNLATEESVRVLRGLLLRENILNKSVKKFIEHREIEITEANNKIESVKTAVQKEIDKTQSQIRELSLKIETLKEEEKEKMRLIREKHRINEETEVKAKRIEPLEMLNYRARNVFSKISDKGIEITLNASAYIKSRVLPCSAEFRHLFPGYKVKFELETDIGKIMAHVTSESKSKEAKYGDAARGRYIAGVRKWYDSHPELKRGSVLVLSVIEPQKKYSLSIK
jgi:hypothetical protein